jgi:hypothetical protein
LNGQINYLPIKVILKKYYLTSYKKNALSTIVSIYQNDTEGTFRDMKEKLKGKYKQR